MAITKERVRDIFQDLEAIRQQARERHTGPADLQSIDPEQDEMLIQEILARRAEDWNVLAHQIVGHESL